MADEKSEDNNPIVEMTPGQILADASVADFIKSMGLSVAEAQKALDVNSISQLGEYVEPRPGLGGKSLLQLGLSPPFYHYQHADLAVSMQLTMKVGRASAFGLGAKLDFGLDTGGPVAAAKAREAQISVKSIPASAIVDGKKTDAVGADVDAAAESLAAALRTPNGPFERALVSSKPSKVKFELDPASAKNPIKTDTAVVFHSTSASGTGVIRIQDTPATNQKETFAWASGKTAEVEGQSNKLLYARAVAQAINDKGDFKARLLRDPEGSTLPVGGGTLAIALFDTGSAAIKPDAAAELSDLARLLRSPGAPVVNVVGFADRTQPEAPNLALGQKRAEAVADFLVKKNGVPAAQIAKVESLGEGRWEGTTDGVRNAQFRRAEVMLAGSDDLMIMVDQAGSIALQDKPLPDRTDGSQGNGFILVRKFEAQAVDATAVKVGDSSTSVAIKNAAVADATGTFAKGSPEAYAFNLARDVNAGSATHKVRATRMGSVVSFTSVDDAAVIDLVTLSANDIKLEAAGGATITKPLAAIAAGPSASKDKPKITTAVGIAVDYRTSRQFEQSVNGNSSISARLVAVPAPVEFLEEIKRYLAPDPATNP